MRRTEREVRRGTSFQTVTGRQGTAARSPKRNGRPRGRPGPAGGENTGTRLGQTVAEAAPIQHDAQKAPKPLRGHPHSHCVEVLPKVETSRAPPARRGADRGHSGANRTGVTTAQSKRRYPPAPLPGTGAALTPVLTKEGPRGSVPRGLSPACAQTRDTVPQPSSRFGSRVSLRSYGSVVGPVGGAPVGSDDVKLGCR